MRCQGLAVAKWYAGDAQRLTVTIAKERIEVRRNVLLDIQRSKVIG